MWGWYVTNPIFVSDDSLPATKKDLRDLRVEFQDFRTLTRQDLRQGLGRINDTLDTLIEIVANSDAYQKTRFQNHERRIRKLERVA